jgi:uncharacterized protein YyaL (SSP411 family)
MSIELLLVAFQAIQKLKAVREKRAQPSADDKLICGWNGLAITALAKGHRVCRGEACAQAFLEGAQKAAGQLRGMLGDGQLCRMVRSGAQSSAAGMLEACP